MEAARENDRITFSSKVAGLLPMVPHVLSSLRHPSLAMTLDVPVVRPHSFRDAVEQERNYVGRNMSSIVTFIGWHDSGKTTLVSQVVHHLKEMGYKVAVIKASCEAGVEFDCTGTDTARHKDAGADSVMFVGPDQMVLQTVNTGLSMRTLAHRYFPDADIVIGEGFKTARKIPKIEVTRNPDQMLRNEVHGVIAVATDIEDIAGDYIFRLNESLEIAQFIEKRLLTGKGRGIDKAALLVNGHKVPLKDFVQESLAATVQGFISALKLVDEITEIELRIKLKK
jgi:molybdopterin-guanine dinucleotide biosynthesis protein B